MNNVVEKWCKENFNFWDENVLDIGGVFANYSELSNHRERFRSLKCPHGYYNEDILGENRRLNYTVLSWDSGDIAWDLRQSFDDGYVDSNVSPWIYMDNDIVLFFDQSLVRSINNRTWLVVIEHLFYLVKRTGNVMIMLETDKVINKGPFSYLKRKKIYNTEFTVCCLFNNPSRWISTENEFMNSCGYLN